MKSTNCIKSLFFLSLIFITGITTATAQSQQESATNKILYNEIAHMDSVLFNAFNTRDTNTFKALFTNDLEFFHDKGGLTDYAYTINSMRNTANSNTDLKRNLVKGSLEVYPIPGYGAIEVGSHTFCHTENSKQDCGTFKFLTVWKKKNDEWIITRVVSYGH